MCFITNKPGIYCFIADYAYHGAVPYIKAKFTKKQMAKSIGVIKLPIKRLHMELTNVCNFSCEFCPDSKMERQRGFMPLEMAKSIIDNVSTTRIAELVLFHVMGEPTLHPNLIDLAEYAHYKNVDVCVTTNGSRMGKDLLSGLIKANVKRVILSLQTPDENTFSMRGAGDLSFEEYAERVTSIARAFINNGHESELTINFLSSPLRRLIIPIAKELSIADTSKKLRAYLKVWVERILKGTSIEYRLPNVLRQITHVKSFKENKITVNDRISFTRGSLEIGQHILKKSIFKARIDIVLEFRTISAFYGMGIIPFAAQIMMAGRRLIIIMILLFGII